MVQGDEVLRVDDLSVYYHTEQGPVKAVEHVSFSTQCRGAAGTGWRIGQWQIDDCIGADADDSAAGTH